MTMDEHNARPSPVVDKSSLFWFAGLLVRARRFVLFNCLVAGIVAVAIALLMPNWYAGITSVLPHKDTGMSLGPLAPFLRDFASLRGPAPSSEAYSYLSILESRNAKEDVIRTFGLMELYEVDEMEKAIREFEGNVEIDLEEKGHIVITVYDRDRQRAADMANYYVAVLNRINIELGLQRTRVYREFLETTIAGVKDTLRKVEEAYRDLQKESRIVILPENQESVKSVAELYSEKAFREIEVEMLKALFGADHPEIRLKRAELQALSERIGEIPDVTLEHVRLYRNIQIQARILEMLLPLYEQAKLDERKALPSVVVLDRAVPPERKAKPKRAILVLSAVFSVGVLSLVGFVFRERLEELRTHSPERYDILKRLFSLKSRPPAS
ncbi:MAG: transport-related membrane protein [Bacteroidia bacterium]|nr:MAG: transport-related membrane protein [Bacteroidia bacterium]